MSGASGTSLFGEGVEVLGDSDLGGEIRDILRRVDIDGEEFCLVGLEILRRIKLQ